MLDKSRDKPENIIYCNSHFQPIQTWLEQVARPLKHLEEDDPRKTLKLDVSNTRAVLFMSLAENIPKMFPNDMLEVEITQEDNATEIYMVIKMTTE